MSQTGVPDSAFARSARALAAERCDAMLLAHCERTYLFGRAIAAAKSLPVEEELAYVACLLHDLGLCDGVPGRRRFEVEGADAAREWVRAQGLSASDAERIWDAVALHTSVGLAPAKSAEAAVVHWGAVADVIGFGHDLLAQAQAREILTAHPRAGFGAHLEALLVAAVRRAPEEYFQTAFADLGHAHGIAVPGPADFLRASHFTQEDL
jgi:HD superfamily phosphodiesterase